MTRLDVSATLSHRRILFVGATGFVGKVALSLLLDRYPGIEKVFVLTRAGAGSSSEERFFGKIVSSPVFDPLRARLGPAFLDFVRARCVPVPGDVGKADLGFSPAIFEQLGRLDLVVNCAGLVTFNPTLESGIRINVLGASHAIDVARRTGASLVHVSTCFVAGNRDGEIREAEPVAGYFPRRRDLGTPPDGALLDADFSALAELTDCQRVILAEKARADDRAQISLFRERAARRLRAEGRDPDDAATFKIAVQRERKVWLAERLTVLGLERAKHWGWTNTYTYTKSLGEQLCAAADVAEARVRTCIVRPAIVESAMSFPFPGWNEGFTTTAPLAYLNIKGHRSFPAGDDVRLDVIPVDYVASGLVMAMAATIARVNEHVYQLGSSDVQPLYLEHAVELLGMHKRRYFLSDARKRDPLDQLRARLSPVPVTKERFSRTSAPMWKKVADRGSAFFARGASVLPTPLLRGLAKSTRETLDAIASDAAQTDALFQMFMPFIHDRRYVFRCDNIRALHARLAPADQEALAWSPQTIDWERYWLDVHLVGLEKWVFPSLEEEFGGKSRRRLTTAPCALYARAYELSRRASR